MNLIEEAQFVIYRLEVFAKMCKVFLNPNRDLLGGYIKLCIKEKELSSAFIREKKKQIIKALIMIRQFEFI